MKSRIEWSTAAPAAAHALFALQGVVNQCGLEAPLLELVKMRASQLNGCAWCLDMHSKDARAAGETEQRLYLLNAWREAAHLYSAREIAALEWTEAVTRLGEGGVPDAVFERARGQFGEAELTNLTLAIIAINGWNRMNVAFRLPAGDYRPGMFKRATGA